MKSGCLWGVWHTLSKEKQKALMEYLKYLESKKMESKKGKK